MSAGRTLAVAALLASLVLPASATAEAVSGAQLRELAARSAGDPAALERLRRVDRVDGRPADVAGSLRGASGAELRARLTALAAAAATRARPDAAAARADAEAILSERRFRQARLEGPFGGVLRRLGRLVGRVRDLVPSVDAAIPGPRGVVWAILIAIAGGLAWLIAGRTVRRRAAIATAAAVRMTGARAETPAALERRAEEAQRHGAHEEALRLRFRAGLLRLDARGAIELRPSLPTGDVARALRSEDFDRLAADFDAIVYGRRPAETEDVDAARRGWAKLMETAR